MYELEMNTNFRSLHTTGYLHSYLGHESIFLPSTCSTSLLPQIGFCFFFAIFLLGRFSTNVKPIRRKEGQAVLKFVKHFFQ